MNLSAAYVRELENPKITLVPYLIASSVFAIACFAFFQNNVGAQNVIQCIAVILGALGIIGALSSNDDTILARAVRRPAVHSPYTLVLHFVTAGILIYHSWFWVGGLYLVGIILLAGLKVKTMELRQQIINEWHDENDPSS